jgi:Phage integrase, N-terminal SAM-like domain
MASVGIRKRVSARTGRVTYQVWWLLDDGSQGAETVTTPAEARERQAEKQLEIARGAWQGRRRGRLSFDRWADEWWAVWSTDPDRSPTTLAATENRLRRHVRPWFGQQPLEAIRPMLIRQWQNQLAGQVGYESLMACRSILFRILQLAEDEGAIAANPVRKVPAPKATGGSRPGLRRRQTPRPHPRGGRPAAGPVPAVLVGPRAVPARHRAPLRGVRRPARTSTPPRPRDPGAAGGRHPLPGRPVRQRLQAPTQE